MFKVIKNKDNSNMLNLPNFVNLIVSIYTKRSPYVHFLKSIKTFEDIKLERGEKSAEGILKITINRPEVRNAFRPQTVFELKEAFSVLLEKTALVELSF